MLLAIKLSSSCNTQYFHSHLFTGHTNTRLTFVGRLLDNEFSSKNNSVAQGIQSDLVQWTFRKTDKHDTVDKHKTTDGVPIENCILEASEMRTFRVPDNEQNRIPTIATPYKKCFT